MRYSQYGSIRAQNIETIAITTHTRTMTVQGNSISDFNVPSSPSSPRNPRRSTRYVRPRILLRVHSNIISAAHHCVRLIHSNPHTLIRNASTVLGEFAMKQINVQADRVEIRAESQALINSTYAATLSFNLRLKDLEHTLGRVTHNIYFMLRRLNDWKNDFNPKTFSGEILDLHTATVGIVHSAAYLHRDGNESDGDLNV